MDFQWTLMPWHTLAYLLLCLMSASGKPLCRETWCQITPQYTTIYVKEGQSEQIVCSIPDLSGSTVEFVNQYGHGIVHTRGLRDVSNYVSFSRLSPTADNVTRYQLNITWTDDVLVREQLKLLQCIANFQGRTNPCRTSVVFVDFEEDANKPGIPTDTSITNEQAEEQMMTNKSSPCMFLSTITMALTLFLTFLALEFL